MLSPSNHLARTSAAATAARYNARPGRRFARHRVAAAVAAAALLAAACSTEEPAPTAEETATTTTAAAAPADTAAPDTTAAPAVTSPCTDPDAEDLGDGLVELDGVVFEVYADACVPRLEEPAGDDDDAPAQDTPSSTTTTVAEPEPTPVVTAQEGEWGGAETDDPIAVVDAVAVEEAGQTIAEPELAPEPEPTPETTPEPGTTPEPEPEPEPEPTPETTPEPEPEPTPEPEPEPEPELDLETWRAQMEECRQYSDSSRCLDFHPSPLPDCVSGVVLDTPCVMENGYERSVRGQSLPDCVRGTVLDTPCINNWHFGWTHGTEQSVLSQQNQAFGGTYFSADDRFFRDATSTIGNHPRDHDVDSHRTTEPHPDFPFNIVYYPAALAAIHPASRGEQPQPLPGHSHGHLPPFTPGVQAWSDWCFFDFEVNIVWPEDFVWPEDGPWPDGVDVPTPPSSTYFCALALHSMSFYLSHLEAPEECILPKATAIVEASEQRMLSWFTPSGSPERQAMSAIRHQNHHLHCPNVIYPDPDAALTSEEHYAILVSHAGRGGGSFADFVSNAWQHGEPTQRQWRARVIGGMPNFRLGG